MGSLTITHKMVDQERPDFYVVLPWSFVRLNNKKR